MTDDHLADVDHGFTVARGKSVAPSSPATTWPPGVRGVTETVVATLGPNERWNLAALGVHAPAEGDVGDDKTGTVANSEPVSGVATARTFGRTRTSRNFRERGGGVVTFVADPRDFVDAALTIREEPAPVLASADAWVEIGAEQVDAFEREGTTVREWELVPVAGSVRRRRPRTINRGFGAVVDATVAASRLEVESFDEGELRERLRYFEGVVERCGGTAEREAFGRIEEHVGWRDGG